MSDENVFYCKGKRLANYLISHGSNLITTGKDQNGCLIFVFENDDSIKSNLEMWESDMKKCLF